MGTVIPKPHAVDKTGAEDVALFDRDNLPPRDSMLQDIAERVGLRQRRVVETVRSEEIVLVRQLLIYTGR